MNPPPPPLQVFALLWQGEGGGEGLTQDLTLILLTKNTEQNKTKKRKPKQESIYYKRSGEGFIVKNICCGILPSLKMPIVKKTCCVLLPLRFMKSFKIKICCFFLFFCFFNLFIYLFIYFYFLRYAVFYCQTHCEEDIAVYF